MPKTFESHQLHWNTPLPNTHRAHGNHSFELVFKTFTTIRLFLDQFWGGFNTTGRLCPDLMLGKLLIFYASKLNIHRVKWPHFGIYGFLHYSSYHPLIQSQVSILRILYFIFVALLSSSCKVRSPWGNCSALVFHPYHDGKFTFNKVIKFNSRASWWAVSDIQIFRK